MSARVRRSIAALLAVVLMIAVAASQKQATPPQHIFRITLGLKDTKPTDWSGEVTVAGGEVIDLAGWRFEEKDAVDGRRGWTCRTHNNIAPGERMPLVPASGEPAKAPQQPWPNGVTLTLRGDAPTVTLTLKAVKIEFVAADLLLGESKRYLDGQVRIERLPATSILRPAAGQDFAWRSGSPWRKSSWCP